MIAYVRKVGAIGIFYPVHFPGVVGKEQWFAEYGDSWELHHFIKVL